MSLENIVADPSLERLGYRRLPFSELEKLDDPEALLERGIRLRNGIGVRMNGDSGWEAIISSAKLGHPVALAFCFRKGRGTEKSVQRAIELSRDSASRGHAAGN